MSTHPQFGGLAEKWSFEAVASLILNRLEGVSGVHLWIVRASRWFLDTFACYTNFVRYNTHGVPDYSGIHGIGGTSSAWRHLDALLKNAAAAVNGASVELPCVIIGFSKGGSVVTQLLYELGMFFDLPEFSDVNLTSQVVSLTWLDSGHNGVTHLWPTWTIPLARLRRYPSPPKLLVFATPYEVGPLAVPLTPFCFYALHLAVCFYIDALFKQLWGTFINFCHQCLLRRSLALFDFVFIDVG